MTIPKLIHVCWFGGGRMSKQIQRCMRSIQALENHGYRVQLWDESNYDMQASPRVIDAYKAKRWSLVSNYVRLDVLQKHGGIYLDTDIEVVRPFDELLEYDFFLGFMWDCALGTAVLGSVPGHPIVTDILRSYDEIPTSFKSPNNDTFTDYFLNMVPEFRLNGREQEIANVFVADKYVFEQPSLFKRLNYTIHHFEQSWKPNSSAKVYVKAAVIKLFSLWLYRKYVCWHSLRISPYYQIFRRVTEEERATTTPSAASKLQPRPHRAPSAARRLRLVPDYHNDAISPWRRRAGVALWMADLQRKHMSSEAPLSGGAGPSVSLTSYGDRTRTVHLTLESIAAGELTPARTILWLGDEAGKQELPENLRRLTQRGLEVRFTKDFGPHTKYYPYVMQERLDQPLVTIDDDILYPRWWLSGLAQAFAKRPNNVHAYRAHVIKLDESGRHFRPYREWSACTNTRASRTHFATGVSGVLYPPEMLSALRAAGDGFSTCCPWADDLWLNLQALRSDRLVAQVRPQSMRFSGILLTQRRGLYHRNVYAHGNDAALAETFGANDMALLADALELAPTAPFGVERESA